MSMNMVLVGPNHAGKTMFSCTLYEYLQKLEILNISGRVIKKRFDDNEGIYVYDEVGEIADYCKYFRRRYEETTQRMLYLIEINIGKARTKLTMLDHSGTLFNEEMLERDEETRSQYNALVKEVVDILTRSGRTYNVLSILIDPEAAKNSGQQREAYCKTLPQFIRRDLIKEARASRRRLRLHAVIFLVTKIDIVWRETGKPVTIYNVRSFVERELGDIRTCIADMKNAIRDTYGVEDICYIPVGIEIREENVAYNAIYRGRPIPLTYGYGLFTHMLLDRNRTLITKLSFIQRII